MEDDVRSPAFQEVRRLLAAIIVKARQNRPR
jgi:hypothetical protein